MGFAYCEEELAPLINFDLGQAKKKDGSYWHQVKNMIIKTVKDANQPILMTASKVFLYGESASDAEFQEVLRDVISTVGELVPNDVDLLSRNPTFSAASGAAESRETILVRV